MSEIDDLIKKMEHDMDAAETALLTSGFNSAQWKLIKAFVNAASERIGYIIAKGVENSESKRQ